MLIDGIVFEVKAIKSRENLENPEVAKFKSKTHNRTVGDYSIVKQSLLDILVKNFPDLIKNTLECDYYIPSLNLLIDDRLDRNHNYNLYRPGNGIQQTLLNELIINNEKEMIRQWCILDLNKSKKMENANYKYLEIYSFKDEYDVLTQIRRMDGLQIVYSKSAMMNELKNIFNKQSSFESGCANNKITNTYNPHFYEQEQQLYSKSITRRWIIENLMKYLVRDYEIDISDGEILRQFRISRICNGFSQHSPNWIKAFIEKYNIKSIYDPCGGWGHRLVGSWCITYIYNDIDSRNVNGARNIIKDLFITTGLEKNPVKKIFYNQDAATLTPTEDYECVFTCPPYFDTELYLNDKTSTTMFPNYKDWLETWWSNVIRSSLKPGVKYFAFIINNQFKQDMSDVCLKHNLELIEEISINKDNNLNHFHRIPIEKRVKMTEEQAKITIKNISKGEKLMIYRSRSSS